MVPVCFLNLAPWAIFPLCISSWIQFCFGFVWFVGVFVHVGFFLLMKLIPYFLNINIQDRIFVAWFLSRTARHWWHKSYQHFIIPSITQLSSELSWLEATLWFFILFRSLPVGLVYTSAVKQLIIWHFSKCFLIWAIKIHLNFKTASKTFHMNNIK